MCCVVSSDYRIVRVDFLKLVAEIRQETVPKVLGIKALAVHEFNVKVDPFRDKNFPNPCNLFEKRGKSRVVGTEQEDGFIRKDPGFGSPDPRE